MIIIIIIITITIIVIRTMIIIIIIIRRRTMIIIGIIIGIIMIIGIRGGRWKRSPPREQYQNYQHHPFPASSVSETTLGFNRNS